MMQKKRHNELTATFFDMAGSFRGFWIVTGP